MAQQIINIGAALEDHTGDGLRTGGGKINDNFTELYARTAPLTDLIDDTSDPLYIYYGSALVGSSESALVWQLARYEIATDELLFAGSQAYSKSWTDRLTEVYA